MNFEGFSQSETLIVYLFFVWTLIWKGLSMWRSAKFSQRNWFIALLLLNTLGLLDIIYLFRFAKKKMTIKEIKHWFQTTFIKK